MEFKDRFEQLRSEKGLSFAQVASEYEKSESAVRAWSAGRTKPDADTLIKLAQYFDCTTDYLLGLSEFKNENKIKITNALLEETAKLFLKLDNSYVAFNILDFNTMLQSAIELKEHSSHYYGMSKVNEFVQLDILTQINRMAEYFKYLLNAEAKDIDKLYIDFISCYEKAGNCLMEYRKTLMSALIQHAKNYKYILEEIYNINLENIHPEGDNPSTTPINQPTKEN